MLYVIPTLNVCFFDCLVVRLYLYCFLFVRLYLYCFLRSTSKYCEMSLLLLYVQMYVIFFSYPAPWTDSTVLTRLKFVFFLLHHHIYDFSARQFLKEKNMKYFEMTNTSKKACTIQPSNML